MKKYILSLLLITVIRLVPCMAQEPVQEEPNPARQQAQRERVEALKIGFISQRLNLSKSESEQFWPVYYQYQKELRAAVFNPNADPISRDEAVLNVRKNYQEQFTRILGRNRSNYFFQSERDFNQMLLKRLNHPGAGARMGLRRGFR
jgi:hypothetical protein